MEPVERFVDRALYDPATGFYEAGGRAGRRGGSFLTSPEVGPLFGAVISRALDAWWDAAGQPAEWVVVDAGAGPGTLARTILVARPRCAPALDLVCVERTAAQRALHPDHVRSAAELPDVADVILFALTRPLHVNLDEIVIKALAQSSGARVVRRERS